MKNAGKIIKDVIVRTGNIWFSSARAPAVPKRCRNILVFFRMAIGDMIMAGPSFRALRRAYSEAHITLCTMRWNKEVADALACFDDIMLVDDDVLMHRNISGLMRLISTIRKQRFDMAVVMDTFLFPFYFYLAGIPVRVGFEYDDEGFALTHKVRISDSEYRSDNFLKVAALTGADVSDRDLAFPAGADAEDAAYVERTVSSFSGRGVSTLVGAVVGGGRNPGQALSAKNWTEEGFAEVITGLVRRENAGILLFGRGDDEQAASRILDIIKNKRPNVEMGHIVNLIDKTTLMQAAAFMRKCRLVLTNDTALMHLAAAVGTPTVSIFGPTDPANLAPRGSRHRYVQAPVPCAPCYGQKGYERCVEDCMRSIPWQRVYAEVAGLLGAPFRDEAAKSG